jgi:hypothetical protein
MELPQPSQVHVRCCKAALLPSATLPVRNHALTRKKLSIAPGCQSAAVAPERGHTPRVWAVPTRLAGQHTAVPPPDARAMPAQNVAAAGSPQRGLAAAPCCWAALPIGVRPARPERVRQRNGVNRGARTCLMQCVMISATLCASTVLSERLSTKQRCAAQGGLSRKLA